jgi:hypothetical protein
LAGNLNVQGLSLYNLMWLENEPGGAWGARTKVEDQVGHELTVVFGLKACGLKPGGQVPLPPPGGLAREDEDLG